ncbi:hypothetical protein [Sporosarcina sp. ACRSM]|nr:hypothetical protein [Sporosarcina sp. ACRSM]
MEQYRCNDCGKEHAIKTTVWRCVCGSVFDIPLCGAGIKSNSHEN